MAIAPNYIGVDVGGTKIHAAAVTCFGKIIRETLVATPKEKGAAIGEIARIAKSLSDDGTVAIGIGVPGPVESKKGIVIELPNLRGWKNVQLARMIAKATDLPCTIENDAKCFLLAEMEYGAARGKKNAVGVIMGTGFGGAIAINGEIYRGSHGSAGEFGHTIISENTGNESGAFRNTGELESFASGKAVSVLAGGKTAKEVFEAARKGDAKARRIVDSVAHYYGVGFSNIINGLDPEIIVAGGSLSNALPQMRSQIEKEIARNCFGPARKTKVVRHKLKWPGTVGAAVACRKILEK